MTQYWYEAERWDDSIVMLTPSEGKEAAVKHMLGEVFACPRLSTTFSMKDFSSVEVSSRPYNPDAQMLEAGDADTKAKDAVITGANGALCRYVKKLVKPRKGDPAYPILRRDKDRDGFVWVYRTQTLTKSTRNATNFPEDWEIFEPWEEDILINRKARR